MNKLIKLLSDFRFVAKRIESDTSLLSHYNIFEQYLIMVGVPKENVISLYRDSGFESWKEFHDIRNIKPDSSKVSNVLSKIKGASMAFETIVKNHMFSLNLPNNKQTLSNQYLDSTDLTDRLVQEMKVYIMRNHSKVDFSEMSIMMTHGLGASWSGDREQQYYATSDINLIVGIPSVKAESIETIEFVLDYADGDFSVTINGRSWMWVDDEIVSEFCRYIEQSISNNINLK